MSSITLQVRLIEPKRMNIEQARQKLLAVLEREGQATKAMFEQVTAAWNHKPEIEVLTSLTGNDAAVLVGTDDLVFKFLNKGTRVRYATMSRDFRAKTRPGVIGSGSGRGRMLFVSRRRPRPGIQARNFTDAIHKKRRPLFMHNTARAVRLAARDLF